MKMNDNELPMNEIAKNYLLDKTCDNCNEYNVFRDGYNDSCNAELPTENTCLSWELKRQIDSQSITTSRLNAGSITAGSISIV